MVDRVNRDYRQGKITKREYENIDFETLGWQRSGEGIEYKRSKIN